MRNCRLAQLEIKLFVVSAGGSKLIKISFEQQSVEQKQQGVFDDRLSGRKEEWRREVVVKAVN